MQRCRLAVLFALSLPACGADDSDDGGTTSDTQAGTATGTDSDSASGGTTGGSTSSGGSTTDASTTDASTTGGSTGGVSDSGSDTDGPPPTEPPPATGIQIVDVTADQAIRVAIAVDGQMVPGNQRNLPLLKGRNTIVRAFYEVDPGYETRNIFATLTLKTGGESHEYTSFTAVGPAPECAGQPQWECRYTSLIHSFNFLVEGPQVQPDATYSIAMVETAPGHENDVSDKVPVFPTDGGEMLMGVEDSYMKMRVVVVPFDHNVGADCPEPPDLNAPWNGEEGAESAAWFLGNQLIAYNPADEVEVVVHSTVNWTGSATSSGALLDRLQSLRSQDGADPGWYYYGVIRPCGGGPSFSGVAQLGGPNMFEADSRVGWGVWHNSISSTAGTFVHEIGHEQGRQHIACNGEEAGPDTSYPDHPDGDTESWGIDGYSVQVDVHPPSDHDYMTYCGSTWVSEWAYSKVLPWIEEISSWENGDSVPEPEEILHGFLPENGAPQWWIGRGWWDPNFGGDGHALTYAADGQMKSQPARYGTYEHSNDHHIAMPVPKGFHGSTMQLAWTDGLATYPIDRSRIELKLPIKSK